MNALSPNWSSNATRRSLARFQEEQAALVPLPPVPLSPCRELRVRVSRFSTIQVLGNTYSVPSRLIGTRLLIRLRAERVEGYVGMRMAFSFPRLIGKQQKRIEYRHVIWSLVKKPGATAFYRYREELFPTTTFRKTYDRLQSLLPRRADREYVRLLHLTAGHSESEVETALQLLLEAKSPPTVEAVRDLLGLSRSGTPPSIAAPPLDLTPYDRFVPSVRRSHA